MQKIPAFLALAAVSAGLACSDSNDPGQAQLRVVITDAPADYLASAEVTIGEVTLIPAEGAPIVVADAAGTFDLLTLQNGVTETIGELEIEPGDYLQIRLEVTAAEVTLIDGYEFNDGSTTKELTVPSGAQSGIKINLHSADGEPDTPGVTIAAGQTILVIDFDVSQNFRIQGNPETPAGINGVLFTPALRAIVSDVAGSISGTVTDADGAPVEGAIVTATPADAGDMEDGQTADATAITDADGAYTIQFVAPGTYSVSAEKDGATSAPVDVEVDQGEDITGVDLEL